jgi:hypothetical protein
MSIENIWNKLRELNSNGVLDTLALLGGKLIWVDGYNGDDANYGTKDSPIKTLDGSNGALARATAGKHDVVVIKSSGATAALSTVRLDAALNWNKACTHIVAQSPTGAIFSPRARIANTAATTAFASFFTLSAAGCLIHGIEFWQGFTTGVAASICMNVTGAYNRFNRCHIAGMGDAASAQSSTSRSLKISSSENTFEDCVIGIDTIQRTVANANLEFANSGLAAAGPGKNLFRRCIFPIWASTTTILAIIAAAGNGAAWTMDRFNILEDCLFMNYGGQSIKVATLGATTNGKLLFNRCMLAGLTGYGTDATTIAQEVITGPTDGSTTVGVGYAPSA